MGWAQLVTLRKKGRRQGHARRSKSAPQKSGRLTVGALYKRKIDASRPSCSSPAPHSFMFMRSGSSREENPRQMCREEHLKKQQPVLKAVKSTTKRTSPSNCRSHAAYRDTTSKDGAGPLTYPDRKKTFQETEEIRMMPWAL